MQTGIYDHFGFRIQRRAKLDSAPQASALSATREASSRHLGKDIGPLGSSRRTDRIIHHEKKVLPPCTRRRSGSQGQPWVSLLVESINLITSLHLSDSSRSTPARHLHSLVPYTVGLRLFSEKEKEKPIDESRGPRSYYHLTISPSPRHSSYLPGWENRISEEVEDQQPQSFLLPATRQISHLGE
jgi:hypothetical protein